jgi:DNA-binding MarR family transcriptional regulator
MAATVSPMTQIPARRRPRARLAGRLSALPAGVAANAVTRLVSRAYEDRFGLSIPQWRLMSVLAEGPLTQQAAVVRTAMDKVRVSRAAQDLVERRLAVRLSNRVDRRSHSLELTAAGRRLFAEIVPLARAYEAALLAGLAPSEVATLKRLLGQLDTRLEHPAAIARATLYGAIDTAPPGSEVPGRGRRTSPSNGVWTGRMARARPSWARGRRRWSGRVVERPGWCWRGDRPSAARCGKPSKASRTARPRTSPPGM